MAQKKPQNWNTTKRRTGSGFWDDEYRAAHHLRMSDKPSEDLVSFARFAARQKEFPLRRRHPHVLDLGCGNGRNLIFLANELEARGLGYDSSAVGIKAAREASGALPITYVHRSIAGTLDVPDNSQDIVLDMMTSHFLNARERELLRDEIYRVMKPGAWFLMKTFLADGDRHTKRLIGEQPGPEAGSYIHPVIGVPEYVYSEDELQEFLAERFVVQKIHKSHKHVLGKRRTISIYAQKNPWE